MWTDDEDRQLYSEVYTGKTIEEICANHGRSHGAIRSRLSQLASDMYQNGGYSVDGIHAFIKVLSVEEINNIQLKCINIGLVEELKLEIVNLKNRLDKIEQNN